MRGDLIRDVKTSAQKLLPVVIRLRREFHQYPELSFEEKETSLKVQRFLDDLGIPYTQGWAGNGIVASIRGTQPGPLMMLRADMDALPITEQNDVPYKSERSGIMHACGHDVHMSSLLGTAAILQEHAAHLRGEVKLVFQPGEEKLPGGASLMIREGLLKPSPPERMIGQHVHPPLPAGHVGFRSGLYMASADEIYITIEGRGGHAATPHLCIDPIVLAARVIETLQELISRNIDPLSPGVLTIGKIQSDGGATNVIPDRVRLEGTLRAMNETWRTEAHVKIRQMVEGLCAASGARAEVTIIKGYPCLINDEKVTLFCREAAVSYLGVDKVHELPQRMTSEDFAFYSQQVPSCFYRLGTGSEHPAKNHPVHSSHFDVDEAALETGMGLMAYIALSQ